MLLDAKTNILSFKDVCRDNEEYADIDPCDIRWSRDNKPPALLYPVRAEMG